MTRDLDLTDAEKRVLLAYVEEETHILTAKRLGISQQTVKNHLGSIYKKLRCRKAHTAVYKLALRAGCDPFGVRNSQLDPASSSAGRMIAAPMSRFDVDQEGMS